MANNHPHPPAAASATTVAAAIVSGASSIGTTTSTAVAATSSSSVPGTSASGSLKHQVPRDMLVMQALLKEMGITSFEPRVLNQMLEFVYRYITSVAEEARVYSTYAKKKVIDIDDVKLAVRILTDRAYSTVPPREMLMEIAKQRNSTPLPLLKASSGLRLPPDRYCLTQPNYQLQFYKRSIAGNTLMSSGSSIRNAPIASSVFKTPTGLPLRTIVTSGSTSSPVGEPDPKKPKLSSD